MAKFFGPIQVLYPVGNQAYKLKLIKKWQIYDVFHLSLLEQYITRDSQMNQNTIQQEFEAGNNKEYKIVEICNNLV